jgi:hypothetical protein
MGVGVQSVGGGTQSVGGRCTVCGRRCSISGGGYIVRTTYTDCPQMGPPTQLARFLVIGALSWVSPYRPPTDGSMNLAG